MVAIIGGLIGGVGSIAGATIGSSGAQQAASTNAAAERAAVQAALTEQQNAFGAAQTTYGMLQQVPGQFAAAAAVPAQNAFDFGVNALQGGLSGGNVALQNAFNSGTGLLSDYYTYASNALNPYVQNGQAIGGQLTGELQSGALGGMPSLTDMSQLPGYQFTLNQGLQATQNAAAAQGLGISGAALKGATNYAENTANTFYNNYLSNYWANQNNRYNMLAGVMNTGAGAANQLGTIASATGGNLGSLVGNLGTAGANLAYNTGAAKSNLALGLATPQISGLYGQGNQLMSSGAQLGAASVGAASAAGQQQGTALTSGAANVGSAQQAAANTTAAGISGAGSSISNALLLNQLLNNSGGGGSTLPSGTAFIPGTTNPLTGSFPISSFS